MRYLLGFLLGLCFMPAAWAQAVQPAAPETLTAKGVQALPTKAVGRMQIKALPAPMPKGAQAFVHQWPGVYFEAAFKGDRFFLKFNDAANEYRLFVDDAPFVRIAQPGNVVLEMRGLAKRRHHLRLEKVTESIAFTGEFQGFYVPKNSQLLARPDNKVQIEFIGDSGMAGYGMRSDTRTCTSEEVVQRSDAQNAFPALTAKRLNADYQVNAYSGRGMVRNYSGEEPGMTLPSFYPYTLFDKNAAYSDPDWKPKIIVIGLGGNDFSTPPNKGEKWASTQELIDEYLKTYVAFLQRLHANSPESALVIMWPINQNDELPELLAAMAGAEKMLRGEAKKIGIKSIDFLFWPDVKLDLSACDSHGSTGDHQKVSDWMTAYFKQRPDYWGN
jgi:lysophospholipase L1-like esterase